MTSQPKIIVAVVAAAIGAAAIAQVANANSATNTETEAATEVQAMGINIPATGFTILEGAHNARLALFEGDVDVAKKLIADASSKFDERAAEIAMKITGQDGFAIPVDSGLQFAQGFEPTEEHAPAITQAGALIQQGELNAAVKVMSDAGIKMDYKVAILPVEMATVNLDQALADINAGQLQKADLALEAVGASVLIEDYTPDALPHQGYPLTEILRG